MESIPKLLEPKPSIDVRRVISKDGFAACILLSRFIKRGRLTLAIGVFVFIKG